jgi:hypothetical protein
MSHIVQAIKQLSEMQVTYTGAFAARARLGPLNQENRSCQLIPWDGRSTFYHRVMRRHCYGLYEIRRHNRQVHRGMKNVDENIDDFHREAKNLASITAEIKFQLEKPGIANATIETAKEGDTSL